MGFGQQFVPEAKLENIDLYDLLKEKIKFEADKDTRKISSCSVFTAHNFCGCHFPLYILFGSLVITSQRSVAIVPISSMNFLEDPDKAEGAQ